MSGWRQFAESMRGTEAAGTIGTKGTESPLETPFVSIVPFVPKASVNPEKVLKQWHEHLSQLDPHAVPAGLDRRDWWQRCEDAWWLYENFAARAVRDGWTAVDLFGVLPVRWGWGGLCDRLRGSRNLKLDRDLAVWSRWGLIERFCRGTGNDLIGAGLTLIWEGGRL